MHSSQQGSKLLDQRRSEMQDLWQISHNGICRMIKGHRSKVYLRFQNDPFNPYHPQIIDVTNYKGNQWRCRNSIYSNLDMSLISQVILAQPMFHSLKRFAVMMRDAFIASIATSAIAILLAYYLRFWIDNKSKCSVRSVRCEISNGLMEPGMGHAILTRLPVRPHFYSRSNESKPSQDNLNAG